MALSDIDLAKIKVDYQAGKLSQRKLAHKHKISRNTLAKYAKLEGWEYGKNAQELSQEIEDRVYKKLVDIEVDRATEITNNYLKDFNSQRNLINTTSAAFAKLIKDKNNKLSKSDAELIFARARIHKILMEGYNIGYLSARKALGMDRDDDVEKARKIKGVSKQSLTDPLEGMTEEEIDKQLEEMG